MKPRSWHPYLLFYELSGQNRIYGFRQYTPQPIHCFCTGVGEINLMDPSCSWLNGLLKSQGLSISFINRYYAVFRQAVERYLGEDGKLIRQNWQSMSYLIN